MTRKSVEGRYMKSRVHWRQSVLSKLYDLCHGQACLLEEVMERSRKTTPDLQCDDEGTQGDDACCGMMVCAIPNHGGPNDLIRTQRFLAKAKLGGDLLSNHLSKHFVHFSILYCRDMHPQHAQCLLGMCWH